MSVTAPAGFRAAGVAAGLKSSGDPDVALVVNDGPDDAAAAVFTTNRFPAALVDGRAAAVKVHDGAKRPLPAILAAVLERWGHAGAVVERWAAPVVLCGGRPVGSVRVAEL